MTLRHRTLDDHVIGAYPSGHTHQVLKGSRVHLRTVRKKDLDTLYELASNVEDRGPYVPQDLASETAFLEGFNKDGFWAEDRGRLLIVENQSDRILGLVVFFKATLYYDAFELGYILYNPSDRGKGYATEALQLFVKYLFHLKNVYRLQLQIQPENEASLRLAEKCGFVREGIARHAIIIHGKPADLIVFSLTREDYEATNAG